MLEIKNLKKKYSGFELDCSFRLEHDQVIGLVGRNGVGKTTLFRSVLWLLRPDSGEIQLFGKPVSQLSESDKTRIGVTFPNSFSSEQFTINEIKQMMTAMYADKFNPADFDAKCKQLDLPVDKKVKNFSTGMLSN